MAILQDMTQANGSDLMAQIEALRAENARLRQAKAKAPGLSMKVTEKGGASLYGLGRFPVTLYAGQWDKLLANVDQIKAFIEANRSKLATKEG